MYTKRFWLLCLSSVTFMASFNMIIPELPSYLTQLGGAEYKGLIISLFTLSAGISRPFSGKLSDLIGRRPIMIWGVTVCIFLGLLYPLFSTVWAFFVLRFLHGFSTGFKPTGTTAYLADIVPDNKRGEALGVLGVSGSMGMAMGPAFGSFIANSFGINAMFYTSSLIALISYITIANMKETLQNPPKFKLSHLKITKYDLFEPRVIKPAFIMFFYSYSFGMLLTITPDFSDHLGINNRGLIFSVILVMSMLMRLVAGKVSDKVGRYAVLLVGSVALVFGTLIIGLSDSVFWFLTGGAIFGISNGIISPTVFALTVDLALPLKRGRALSAIFISLEMGIGAGALVSAALYNNLVENFPIAFWSGSVMGIISMGLILYHFFRQKKDFRLLKK